MPFDFVSFFKREGVHFATEGRNVAHGHVNIQCPFCGQRDPSEHLGINLRSGAWGCWRDSLHRGYRPERLIRILKDCSWEQAIAIAEDELIAEEVELDELADRVEKLFVDVENRQFEVEPIDPDHSFRKINREGLTESFFDYVTARSFGVFDVEKVIEAYSLRCALTGDWKQRLIFPFFYKRELVGWTARAIGKAEVKYISHPEGRTVKQILYNYDEAVKGGDVLVITEGPFDCLKIDFYGQEWGMRAVGLLGVVATRAQVRLLTHLGEFFRHVVIALDADASDAALYLSFKLGHIDPRVAFLPWGVKDPAELEPGEVETFYKKFRERS